MTLLYNSPNDIYWDRAWTFAFAQYYNEIFHFSQERITDKMYKKICSKNHINYRIKMN